MIDLTELLSKHLDITQGDPELTPVVEAVGRRLASSYDAPEHVPAFRVSSVDGFAVRSVDVAGSNPAKPSELLLVDEIAAGQEAKELNSGEAAPIMTGAPVPAGADTCVMVEDSDIAGDLVHIQVQVPEGAYIREVGSAITQGQLVVESNTVLTPAGAASLQSLGVTEVLVHPKTKVAIASTGLELVAPDEVPTGAQIRDVNRTLLRELLEASDCEVVDLGIVPDDQDSVLALIERAKDNGASAVISTGGVSMGRHDYVKALAMEPDNNLGWYQVAIKPAKPLVFGEISDIAYFGLPGNPVSALVSFTLIVRTYLDRSRGIDGSKPITAELRSATSKNSDHKIHYRAGRLDFDGGLIVELFGEDSSHQINSYATANCLVELGEPRDYVVGEQVRVHKFDSGV